jgi:hypothetical protein
MSNGDRNVQWVPGKSSEKTHFSKGQKEVRELIKWLPEKKKSLQAEGRVCSKMLAWELDGLVLAIGGSML